MCRHLIVAASLLVIMSIVGGCVAPTRMLVREERASQLAGEKIVRVISVSGEPVNFDGNGARYYESYYNQARVIVGRTVDGQVVVIGVNQVQQAFVETEVAENGLGDPFATVIVMGLVIAAVHGSQK